MGAFFHFVTFVFSIFHRWTCPLASQDSRASIQSFPKSDRSRRRGGGKCWHSHGAMKSTDPFNFSIAPISSTVLHWFLLHWLKSFGLRSNYSIFDENYYSISKAPLKSFEFSINPGWAASTVNTVTASLLPPMRLVDMRAESFACYSIPSQSHLIRIDYFCSSLALQYWD